MARQESERLAVFRHGAARHGQTGGFEFIHDLLVAERLVRVLGTDEHSDGILHAGVAHLGAARREVAGGEKKFHFENSLRRGHRLPGNGAADRGLVHAHGLGDLRHGHGHERRHAFLKEWPLPSRYLPRNGHDGLLALLDAFVARAIGGRRLYHLI